MKIELSEIACLIPARKGSKRVRNKNLIILANKPLLQYTMEMAAKSDLTNIFFSTNYLPDEITFKIPDGITWVSRAAGLSGDDAKANLYIRHFLNRYPNFKAVMLLQPTSPLRTTSDINRALRMYMENKCPLLASVCKLDSVAKIYKTKASTKKVYSLTGEVDLKMEEEPVYYRNGAIYIFSKEHFEKENSIFGSPTLSLEMPWVRSIDINILEDVKNAEKMIKSKGRNQDDIKTDSLTM